MKLFSKISDIFSFLACAVFWCVAWLPMPILEIFSDILFCIIYHFLRYRRKVVRENLRNAFPEKSETERKIIEKNFYKNLCDNFFGTLFLLHAKEKDLEKRISFENLEIIENYFAKKEDIIAVFGHFGNWEWIVSIPIFAKFTTEGIFSTLYKPLSNRAFDKMLYKIRSRFGVMLIAKKNSLRAIFSLKKEKKNFLMAFIGDQTPSWENIHFWTTFLNQETPFLTGWENIARKTNMKIVYFNIQKTARNKFKYVIEDFCDNPKDFSEFELVKKYAKKTEENVLQNPEIWLWSHKRWKHKRTK